MTSFPCCNTYDSEGEWRICVGDIVHDDLTGQNATVIKITEDKYGNIGIWLNNEYVGGGRHPWEIQKL